MRPPRSSRRRPGPSLFTLLVLLLIGETASVARAQQQESELLRRIEHPDLTLAYHPGEKRFGGSDGSALRERRAATRGFPFGRRATVRSYRAKDFAGERSFRSGNFAGRDRAAAGMNPAAGRDRVFASRSVDTREARDARKALPVRPARTAEFTVVGKRQDALDEQQRTRPLTIEEVRELLNKPQ